MMAQVKSPNRMSRREIAESTLKHLDTGTYTYQSTSYDLRPIMDYMKEHTVYYPSDSELLSSWQTPLVDATKSDTKITLSEISTLQGARQLTSTKSSVQRVAVLNFASAKHEGGGFKTGAQAQEESLARSSTLYESLMTPVAQQFYRKHKKDPGQGYYSPVAQQFYRKHKKDPGQGYYSHAMIFSPRVTFFRDDDGNYLEPFEVDIVVCAAVNAGVARQKSSEREIEAAMKERMGRILYLCESRGTRDLILGSFGTGVFRNKVESVARIWRELLVDDGARFKHSFANIKFAILGTETFKAFKETFGDVV